MQTERADHLCPKCLADGKAVCIVMGRGVRTVHYRCLACNEEWMPAHAMPHDRIPFLRWVTTD